MCKVDERRYFEWDTRRGTGDIAMNGVTDDFLNCGPDELVSANKILFKYGVVDGFGHVSMRCQDNPDHFWLARNCAPALVGPDDIIRHNLEGEAVGDDSLRLYLERFIHAAVYKRREDVRAVVHSHSNTLVPFSVSKAQKLVPVWHMAGFLGHEVSVFDTAEKFGKDTDLLITDMDMADAMADCLTGSDVVLMRGHGATLCGRSLPEAVYRAIYAELNAQILLQATSLGAFTALSAGECKATVDRISPQIGRAWNLWLREVGHG